MHALRRRLPKALFDSHSSTCFSRTLTTHRTSHPLTNSPNSSLPLGTLISPWSAIQHRGVKVLGTDIRFGNVIQRKGRIYQVLKSQHTQHGRGGATIQVELRDVDSGNKVTERFRTDEAIEKVFVEDKSFTFLYREGDNVTLMEPNTFEQMDVSHELFGQGAAYLTDGMKVTLQFYNGKPMSGSVPKRVKCTVAEAKPHIKGLTATPQYKRVLLENGYTVLTPPFIVPGDEIYINSADGSYITRSHDSSDLEED